MSWFSTHSKTWRHPSLNKQWLAELLEHRVVNAKHPRKHEKVTLPSGKPAILKLMAASRHRYEPWSSINIFPRLKPRFAYDEGRAYRLFEAAGLAVPKLYAYGEDWRFGLRGRGFVLVEWSELPLLKTQLQLAIAGDDKQRIQDICFAWTAYLAAVHSSGWVHGDADSDNFLLNENNEIVAIDLEKSQPLKAKNQLKELNRAKRCLTEHGLNDTLIAAAIDHYKTLYSATY